MGPIASACDSAQLVIGLIPALAHANVRDSVQTAASSTCTLARAGAGAIPGMASKVQIAQSPTALAKQAEALEIGVRLKDARSKGNAALGSAAISARPQMFAVPPSLERGAAPSATVAGAATGLAVV